MALGQIRIIEEGIPGMGHNSKAVGKAPQPDEQALKSETAQELIDAPHSEVTKAAIRGECADVGGVAGKRLMAFFERIERLEEEKKAMAEDIKDIFSEAKGAGFEVTIMRKVLKLRKMDVEKRQEQDELLNLYMSAIGME